MAAHRRPPAINVALAGAALACAVLAGEGLTSTATAGAEGPDGGASSVMTGGRIRLGPPSPAATTPHPAVWSSSASWDRAIRATPTSIHIPALGVNAPITPVEVRPDGELAVPDDPRLVGWWQLGAHPDEPGAVVIAGHVDTAHDGPGALFRLARARAGQPLTVQTNLGPRRYVVTDVHHYAKADLPAHTFTATGPPHLILITCGGTFNTLTRQYADNIVVDAAPA